LVTEVSILSVNRQDRSDGFELTDSLIKKVHTKNQYACGFCGFKAKKHQEVIDRNGIYDESNNGCDFVTVCPLCMVSNRLSKYGNKEIGMLVYVPELTQAEINNIYHLYWASLCFDDLEESKKEAFDDEEQSFKINIAKFVGQIENRNLAAIDMYGEGINDLVMISDILFSMPEKNYASRGKIFKNLRFIPNLNFFKEQREYYQASIYHNFTKQNRTLFKDQLLKSNNDE
jgi:intracellular multiplication protein IcmJ